MVRKHGRQTLAADTFERLRGSILAGRHVAGARLLPAELGAELGVSTSVIREALIRLSEQGLVEVSPNRGFSVTRVSDVRLRELIEMRIVAETAALRMSIARGSLEWESGVVAAHHFLSSLDSAVATERDRWLAAHLAFHEQLLSGCENQMLLDTCAELLRAGDLYLRWSAKGSSEAESWTALFGRDHAAEHRGILDAVLRRDADLAAHRYEAHLRLTGSLILDASPDATADADASVDADPPAAGLDAEPTARRSAASR